MPDLLCCAGDYRWHAAKVTMTEGKRGEAQLHPVPADGPEVVEFDIGMGGHIRWLNEKQRLFFFVSKVHHPIPGHPKWGRIRIAFGGNQPHPNGVARWVYETDYDTAQRDYLADPERRRHGTPR